METITCDIAVIGSGMGGGTMAWALRDSGADVVLLERGERLPAEPQNWSARSVFVDKRYKNAEDWVDENNAGQTFTPGVHYYVGGNTKVYGACLPRFRAEDFEPLQHHDGVSAGWAVTYDELEPYYGQAERLLGVHGTADGDPTEPYHSSDYPYPALDHEPDIAELARRVGDQGLNPFRMPMGVDVRPGGRCVVCATCDGYPCKVDAKSDAEVKAVRPAVESGVRLMTGTYVERLETGPDGRTVTAAVGTRDGRPVRVLAQRYVLAAGAVNTAAVLLRSGDGEGLANGSGLVGRRYMVHNSTFFVAIDPRRKNRTTFQKTLGLNDWYLAGDRSEVPLGNLQMLGKLQSDSVRAARPWAPTPALEFMTNRSVDIYLTTEDLPSHDNRVVVRSDGRIGVHWTPNNLEPHRRLVDLVTTMMRRAGYPLVFTERMGIETNSHQCGTALMGGDPATSVVRPDGRTHEVDNLWISDSSIFASSAALNPALTIAANALRIAEIGGLRS